MAICTTAASRSATGFGRVLPMYSQRRVVARAEAGDDKSVPQQKDTVFYGGNSYTAAEVRFDDAGLVFLLLARVRNVIA